MQPNQCLLHDQPQILLLQHLAHTRQYHRVLWCLDAQNQKLFSFLFHRRTRRSGHITPFRSRTNRGILLFVFSFNQPMPSWVIFFIEVLLNCLIQTGFTNIRIYRAIPDNWCHMQNYLIASSARPGMPNVYFCNGHTFLLTKITYDFCFYVFDFHLINPCFSTNHLEIIKSPISPTRLISEDQ